MVDVPVELSTEIQMRVGLARAIDAGPVVVGIDPRLIVKVVVDGVGMDIDEPCTGGSMSVDGRDSVQHVGRVSCIRG
jgi:ABC-type transporter Mla maintaining outer membrane lipid asymmetry ATPase subunit MlaF